MGNQELDFSNISGGGPCKKVSEDPTCSNQQDDPTNKNYGTCTNNGVTFDVCCPPDATGTYAVGDSCTVTVPGIGLPPSTIAEPVVVMPGDDSTPPDTVFIDADASNVVISPPAEVAVVAVPPSQSLA